MTLPLASDERIEVTRGQRGNYKFDENNHIKHKKEFLKGLDLIKGRIAYSDIRAYESFLFSVAVSLHLGRTPEMKTTTTSE